TRQLVSDFLLQNRTLAQIIAMRLDLDAFGFQLIDVVEERVLAALVGNAVPDRLDGFGEIDRSGDLLVAADGLDDDWAGGIGGVLVVRIVNEKTDLLERIDDVLEQLVARVELGL